MGQAAGVAPRGERMGPGGLEAGLGQLGREAGGLSSYGSQITSGLKSRGLEGQYTPEQGLNALLEGTGLQAMAGGNNGFTLQPVNAVGAPIELGVSTVVGDRLGAAPQTNVFEHPGARDVIRREEFERAGATSARDVHTRIPGANAPD
ncbi:TonB-dependent receptor, partial [Pseudomonas syringae]